MNRLVSLIILAAGVALIIHGVNASDSVGSAFSRLFTGAPTDRTIWLPASPTPSARSRSSTPLPPTQFPLKPTKPNPPCHNTMKITPSILFLAALSPAVILISGCAKADTETAADQIPATAATTTASDTAAEASVLRNASAAVDSPININDYTYDKRADLAAGMQRMAQACVADYTTMQTALAALPPAAVAKRDLAVDEFTAARTAMSAQIVNVRDGTVDDWSATKEKTALALKRLQDAVAGVKASTVS